MQHLLVIVLKSDFVPNRGVLNLVKTVSKTYAIPQPLITCLIRRTLRGLKTLCLLNPQHHIISHCPHTVQYTHHVYTLPRTYSIQYYNFMLSYLNQEEGHSICSQRPGQLYIFHLRLDFSHLATAFVFLQVKQY